MNRLRYSLIGLVFAIAPGSLAASATVEIPQIVYNDLQNKPFGIDDRFIVTVETQISHAVGLRARIFGGTKKDIMAAPFRTTADGCRILDSNVFGLRRIDGRINLGFLFGDSWLKRDPFTGQLTEASYTMVIEQGRDPVPLIKISPTDMPMYFQYAYEFKVRPLRQVERKEPLTTPDIRKADQVLDRLDEQRQERAAEIISLSEQELDRDCVVFRTVKATSQVRSQITSPWAALLTRFGIGRLATGNSVGVEQSGVQ